MGCVIDAKDYAEAARERVAQGRFVFDVPQEDAERELDDKRYALVVYLSGLAVECVFRAYRLKTDMKFDGRHNLESLFAVSGLDEYLREALETEKADDEQIAERVRELRAAVKDVASLWRNAYRYASDRVLLKDLVERGLVDRKMNKGSKAEVLRARTREVLDAAETIVRAGEDAWT
jgi:hypothetical protein